MGRLIYGGIGSLDGFIADVDGDFSWSAPDEQVHAYLNDRDRGVAAELYGRRLYEVMKVWETYGTEPDASSVVRDYGRIWRDRDKVVYSTTLADVDTARTRLERTFDPVQARRFVDEAGETSPSAAPTSPRTPCGPGSSTWSSTTPTPSSSAPAPPAPRRPPSRPAARRRAPLRLRRRAPGLRGRQPTKAVGSAVDVRRHGSVRS